MCTTEFIAFAKMYPEFQNRNCCLLGLSIDSNPSHLAWVYNIHKHTGVEIPFPIISDLSMDISKKYGMIAPNVSDTHTIRSVFFIDPEGVIRTILDYPMTTGRNIPELLRILDSLQLFDKEGFATPANWLPGQPTILPVPKTYKELMERVKNKACYNCMDWYLCFNSENPTPYQMNPMSIQENTLTNMNMMNTMGNMGNMGNMSNMGNMLNMENMGKMGNC